MVFNKTTIMSFIYPVRFASITWKQELQTAKTSSKAIKHHFNKTLLCLSLRTFSRRTLKSVQSHTNRGFFKLIMLLLTQ